MLSIFANVTKRERPSLLAHVMDLSPDERMKLFHDPETIDVPHALYADHRGDLVVRPDAGEFVESCGLVRLVEPISYCWVDVSLTWDTPACFEEETLRAVVMDDLDGILAKLNGNLFAGVPAFRA